MTLFTKDASRGQKTCPSARSYARHAVAALAMDSPAGCVLQRKEVVPLAPTNAKLEAVPSSNAKIMLFAYKLSSLSASI
jgi:hypothetical protein